MAKLLLYGDLHIGASRTDNEKIKSTIQFINQKACENHVDGIINLGDTLDCSGGRKQLLSPAIIELLQNLDLREHYVLRGNHEYHNDGDLLSVLNCKQFIRNPTIIFDHCFCIPFTKTVDKNFYPDKSHKYVFAHCDFHGANYDNGHTYKGKNDKILDGVVYHKLFLGHYHIYQKISNNVTAIGAAQSRIKSDNPTPLGITIIDTVSDIEEFIPNPYAYLEPIDVGKRNRTASEYVDNTSDEVINERQSIIDNIVKIADSGVLLREFFMEENTGEEIIISLTQGILPDDFA